jgi:hypothetical protein
MILESARDTVRNYTFMMAKHASRYFHLLASSTCSLQSAFMDISKNELYRADFFTDPGAAYEQGQS